MSKVVKETVEEAAAILQARREKQRERQRLWRRKHGYSERVRAKERRQLVRELEVRVKVLELEVKKLKGVEVELGV